MQSADSQFHAQGYGWSLVTAFQISAVGFKNTTKSWLHRSVTEYIADTMKDGSYKATTR